MHPSLMTANCFNKNSTIAVAHTPESPDINTLQSSDFRTSEIDTIGTTISTHIIRTEYKMLKKTKQGNFKFLLHKLQIDQNFGLHKI
jgi:hypothetical protein